jgi:methionyl-tRNA formyltransferase
MTSPLRLAFAGTPEFAAAALQALVAAGHPVALALTQPDRPSGRGMKLTPSPVKQVAQSHDIPVIQPRSLKLAGRYPEDAQSAQDALKRAQVDVMVVAAYGLILPQWVLDVPRMGCLNIHASLLPRWRGAAPIHRAIEAGDASTGITIMQMDAGLDTGDMLLMSEETIQPSDTTGSLHDRLADQGAQLIVQALAGLAAGDLRATPQPSEGITYAHKIDKSESLIDWRLSAVQIERRVRAFDPFPGASFLCAGETVKVWSAQVRTGVNANPGTVVSVAPDRFTVACGEQGLEILQVQRPGGKRVPATALLQARPDLLGMNLASTMGLGGAPH